MIVLKNISFGYEPDKPALSNVEFTVGQGETLAIVGVSDSGKSTILRLSGTNDFVS